MLWCSRWGTLALVGPGAIGPSLGLAAPGWTRVLPAGVNRPSPSSARSRTKPPHGMLRGLAADTWPGAPSSRDLRNPGRRDGGRRSGPGPAVRRSSPWPGFAVREIVYIRGFMIAVLRVPERTPRLSACFTDRRRREVVPPLAVGLPGSSSGPLTPPRDGAASWGGDRDRFRLAAGWLPRDLFRHRFLRPSALFFNAAIEVSRRRMKSFPPPATCLRRAVPAEDEA